MKKLSFLILAFALFTLGWLVSGSAYAAPNGTNINVTSQDDSLGGQFCTLRDAIIAANTDSKAGACPAGNGADIIHMPAFGQFKLSVIDHGSEALPNITSYILIDGNASQLFPIKGAPDMRIFNVQAGGTLLVDGLFFVDTSYANGGGALYNLGTAIISNSSFIHNSNSYADGAAIYNDTGAQLWVTDSYFGNNSAGNRGGALFNAYGAQANLAGDDFNNSSAVNDGGAIYSAGDLKVDNTSFSTNHVVSGSGGAIFMSGTASIQTSYFTANQAVTFGGALRNNGILYLLRTTLDSNHANAGGALYTQSSATIANSTFVKNTAEPSGSAGAIYSLGTTNVYNSSLNQNGGAAVGTLAVGLGTTTLANSIVANSTSGVNCGGALTDGGHNLRFPLIDSSCVGAHGDPKFGPLTVSGASIWVMPLLPGSAARDTAGDTVCANSDVSHIDETGTVRPQGPHCDIGALEMAYVAPPTPTKTATPLKTPTKVPTKTPAPTKTATPPAVCNAKPIRPDITEPVGGAKLTKSKVALSWSTVKCGTTYQFKIKQDAKKSIAVAKAKKLNTTDYLTKPLAKHHTYYWWVKACNSFGCTKSLWQSFIIK